MKKYVAWWKRSYGKKLKALHTWNAWVVLFLAVSGVLLFLPSFRSNFSSVRVGVKQLHIIAGLVSIVLLFLYAPLLVKHLKQVKGKLKHQWNLWIVLSILAGWSASGVILWQFRNLPQSWSNTTLLVHDLFTWIGVPYAIYHSITRMRWMKSKSFKSTLTPDKEDDTEGRAVIRPRTSNPVVSRRGFIRLSVGTVLVVLIGPSFYRWLKRVSDNGGNEIAELAEADGNRMLPPPTPHPDSLKPIGGGGEGTFRVYTVTDIPSFTSDNWKFTVNGHVSKTLAFDWEQFLKLERKVQVSDFHCVTGWSVYHVTWEGIPLSKLLDLAQVTDKGKFVKFYSGDGVYTDALTLEQARMDDVMVVVLMDGKPIPQKLGGPVKLLVPQMYTYKSVKWLQSIELIDTDHIGFWELRGYDTDAWIPGAVRV